MTREQAIAVLVTLPIGPPRCIEPAPDEIIVCECTEPVRPEMVRILGEQLRSIWPEHRIIIVQAGLSLRVESGTVQ